MGLAAAAFDFLTSTSAHQQVPRNNVCRPPSGPTLKFDHIHIILRQNSKNRKLKQNGLVLQDGPDCAKSTQFPA